GRTTFRLPAGARGLVRVLLNRDRHGPPLATSRPVRLKNGKPAADPLPAPERLPARGEGGAAGWGDEYDAAPPGPPAPCPRRSQLERAGDLVENGSGFELGER